jgi:homogentisate 1,2-dioxygenase
VSYFHLCTEAIGKRPGGAARFPSTINADYDEVLFYHEGDFFSRTGIQPGMLTLHPQGIHHGPQPQAVQASKGKTDTSEVAVMIESKTPFTVRSEMEAVEIKDYALSWSRR